MSIADKVEELSGFISPEGEKALAELKELVTPYEPAFQLKALQDVVLSKEDVSDEVVHGLLDRLEMSVARYSRPRPERFNSFKTDLLRYFGYCHKFVDNDMHGALFEYMLFFHKMFSEPKKICGTIRISCHNKDCTGKFSDPEQYKCLLCGSYRSVCTIKPASNGRCTRMASHGGRAISGVLNGQSKTFGRVQLYKQSLNGELQRMYIEAVTDQNYLSVAPEIGALAARSAELMSQIGDTDYLAVSARVEQSLRRMQKALIDEEYFDVEDEAVQINKTLKGVADDKRRWDEIAALSNRLGRLSETERKRLIEQQKMITVQEMYLLQQETLAHIRDAASVVAVKVIKRLKTGGEVSERDVRNIFLTTLHGIIKGDVSPEYTIASGSDEPVIIDAE